MDGFIMEIDRDLEAEALEFLNTYLTKMDVEYSSFDEVSESLKEKCIEIVRIKNVR